MNCIYIYEIKDFMLDAKIFEKELSDMVLMHVNKYKVKEDYIRSLLGWYLLSKYIKEDFKIDLNKTNIILNGKGKPYIYGNIKFNISHSHNYVVVMIADGSCGIDIEMYDTGRDWKKIKDKILSKIEVSKIKKDEDIVKWWTIKEAYFKMIGTGLVLSELKENIDYKIVETMRLKDANDNDYYLSYICETDTECMVKKITIG